MWRRVNQIIVIFFSIKTFQIQFIFRDVSWFMTPYGTTYGMYVLTVEKTVWTWSTVLSTTNAEERHVFFQWELRSLFIYEIVDEMDCISIDIAKFTRNQLQVRTCNFVGHCRHSERKHASNYLNMCTCIEGNEDASRCFSKAFDYVHVSLVIACSNTSRNMIWIRATKTIIILCEE